MPNMQLADNLRHLRQQHNLTQTELGRILNISRQAYSNYETNKRTPDLDSLLRLSAFYHVALNDLVLGNLRSHAPSSGHMAEDATPYILATDKNTGNTLYLTGQETEMLLLYRRLSDEHKQIITGFIHSNADQTD